ncbi:MAG: hypothetical protein ACEPOV_01470 [Hyphomicrobiales bacterium]
MNKLYILTVLLLLICSCKKNKSYQEEVTPSIEESFPAMPEDDEKLQLLTLSSMTFVSKNNPELIKDSLKLLLGDSRFITGGNWELAYYKYNDEKSTLVFIVKYTKLENTYAICSRGSNNESAFNFLYDADFVTTSKWPYKIDNNADLDISKGIFDFHEAILAGEGEAILPFTGSYTMDEYIDKILLDGKSSGKPFRLYFTGYSLGAAVSTCLGASYLYKIVDKDSYPKIHVGIYAFAGPSIGTKPFVDYYNNLISTYKSPEDKTSLSFLRVYNNNGVVGRCFFDSINNSVNLGYPITLLVRGEVLFITKSVQKLLDSRNIQYYKIGDIASGTAYSVIFDSLPGRKDLPETCHTLKEYIKYVDFNHDHNNMIQVLGGTTVP